MIEKRMARCLLAPDLTAYPSWEGLSFSCLPPLGDRENREGFSRF
jgi:hypothetical protein